MNLRVMDRADWTTHLVNEDTNLTWCGKPVDPDRDGRGYAHTDCPECIEAYGNAIGGCFR